MAKAQTAIPITDQISDDEVVVSCGFVTHPRPVRGAVDDTPKARQRTLLHRRRIGHAAESDVIAARVDRSCSTQPWLVPGAVLIMAKRS